MILFYCGPSEKGFTSWYQYNYNYNLLTPAMKLISEPQMGRYNNDRYNIMSDPIVDRFRNKSREEIYTLKY